MSLLKLFRKCYFKVMSFKSCFESANVHRQAYVLGKRVPRTLKERVETEDGSELTPLPLRRGLRLRMTVSWREKNDLSTSAEVVLGREWRKTSLSESSLRTSANNKHIMSTGWTETHQKKCHQRPKTPRDHGF